MKLFFTLCLLLSVAFSEAQDKYIVVFKDKTGTPYTLSNPEQYLSQRSIQRRSKQNIAIDSLDLPISPAYLSSVRQVGATVICQSKWFNYAVISADSLQALLVGQYNFVDTIFKVMGSGIKRPASIGNTIKQSSSATKTADAYGNAETQIAMINGKVLHQMGYRGKGMLIAVLDAGFQNANTIAAFDSLRNKGQLLATQNFVEPATSVYSEGYHGTSVLSCMAANVPNTMIGTAPDASYVLLRSEDDRSEYLIEEYNYVAAAEFADSIGADVINASLGYSEFKAHSQDHTYADMNGRTTICSKGAQKAFEKGMIVVNSAGNEGAVAWHYITAPSDAVDVLCIGSVDESKQVAATSSRGPSSDNRIKPDVAAMGQGAYVADTGGGFVKSNGTSFSSPIITGMVACFWQAFPQLSNKQIINYVRKSGDRYTNPDENTGYGIPDFGKAYQIAAGLTTTSNAPLLRALINPFSSISGLLLEYNCPTAGDLQIRVYNNLGSLVHEHSMHVSNSGKQTIAVPDMNGLAPGMYFVSIQNNTLRSSLKVIKQ